MDFSAIFNAIVGIVASAPTSVGIKLTVISLAAAAFARTKVGCGLDDSMTGSLEGGPFRRHWNVSRSASGNSQLGLAPSYNKDRPPSPSKEARPKSSSTWVVAAHNPQDAFGRHLG